MAIVTFRGGFIRVHEQQIHGFGRSGGAMWRLVDDVGQHGMIYAQLRAPRRSNELAMSMERRRPVYRAMTHTATGRFGPTAEHAPYVLFGTSGPITAKNGPFMVFSRPYPPRTRHKEVSGQRPNNFMEDAVRVGGAANGLVFR